MNSSSKNMKQNIMVRTDLKMKPGKLASQCSHASVEAVLKSPPSKIASWKKQGMKKVILKVDSQQELLNLQKKAKSQKLITALIKDAGKTFFKSPTITCLAIGPDSDQKIDKITSKLKLIN